MVTRKPLPDNASIASSVGRSMQDVRQELCSATDSEASAERIWGGEPNQTGWDPGNADKANRSVPAPVQAARPSEYGDLQEENVWSDSMEEASMQPVQGGVGAVVNRVPSVLKPGGSHSDSTAAGSSNSGGDVNRVPTILRPGGSPGRPETNPFKRQMTGASSSGPPGANTQEFSRAPSAANIPLSPSASLSQLNLNEPSKNPWQPALDKEEALSPNLTGQQATTLPSSTSLALMSLPSEEESAGWGEESRKESLQPGPQPVDEKMMEDTHAWDDLGTLDKGKAAAKPIPAANTASTSGVVEDWNLVNVEAPPGPPPGLSKQDNWENFADGEDEPPALPKRKAQDGPPSLPPRRDDAIAPQHQRAVSKSETYQIKNIAWFDANAGKNTRTSPILVQNANGPCPLVALVNALTLTSPADTTTALVDVLRSREQVSLNLLLDAVFDELMSPRRTKEGDALPDVTELYAFLQGLHTGMNVNPRFIPTPEAITAFKRTSLTHLHPTERGNLIPGTFEDTNEMDLYSTFSIPLIHGWLPEVGEPAYDAFARNAVSYEDAQNLMFREEELEDKLSSPSQQGLTPEEQQIYQDILTIKSFLSISATQLTSWGLEVITKAMRPGSVAILFRNDHFSTLYRHPQTLELLTLVTDAGYAGHAEIVWESLVDVNGESAEFLSGDFRVVGGASHVQDGDGPSSRNKGGWYDDEENDNGWTTVQGRKSKSQMQPAPGSDVPMSPKHEQEDRDLALALQLQEEEEERHRTEQAHRRRESQLSEQFIEQQGRTPNPALGGQGGTATTRGGGRGSSGPAATAGRRTSSAVNTPVTTNSSRGGRGNGSGAGPSRVRAGIQNVRSLLPPRNEGVNRSSAQVDDDAPPSYDEAAKEAAYVPPEGHPSHPTSSSDRRTSASTAASGSMSVPQSALVSRAGRVSSTAGIPPGRMRQGVPPTAVAGNGGRDRDCVVM